MINFSRKIMIFLFINSLLPLYAQIDKKHQQEIQHLWDNSDAYMLKDNIKSVQYAKEASLLSEKYGDSFNKAKSYLILGRSLLNVHLYKESLLYLDKSLKEPVINSHPLLKVIIKELKGDNYGNLELLEEEFKEYSDILSFIPQDKKNHDYQRLISRTYARMSYNLIKRSEYDKANTYINKALAIQQKWSEGELYNIYLIKGEVCLYRKNYDSAYHYFDKSYKRIRKGVESEYTSLKYFGDYYKETGDNLKALKFYENALTDMEKFKVTNVSDKRELYNSIAQLSESTGDIKKKNQYLELYQKESEKVLDKNNKDVQAAVQSILAEKDEEKHVLKQKSFYTIFSLIVVFIILLGIFYFKFMNIRRRKRQLRTKFDKIVAELEERKKQEHEKESEKKTDYFQQNYIVKKENLFTADQKLISDEKEKELIFKLEEFERGRDFTEKGFTQSNLTAILGTNTKYLTYILKEHRNKNFNDYINGLKINFVVNKLYDHPKFLTYKISFLSELSGFSSQSRFTHIFKKELGMSPSEFITQLSEKNAKHKKLTTNNIKTHI